MSKSSKLTDSKEIKGQPPLQSPIDFGFANPVVRMFDASEVRIDWKSSESGVVGKDKNCERIIEFKNSQNRLYVQIPGDDLATEFTLAQLHFHARSEHRVFGATWPVELHIVHTALVPDEDRKCMKTIYAAIGVMIEESDDKDKVDNAADTCIKAISRFLQPEEKQGKGKKKGDPKQPMPSPVYLFDPIDLIPFDPHLEPLQYVPFWRYEGSLTSDLDKPSDSDVSWIVLNRVAVVKSGTLDYWTGGDDHVHSSKRIQPLERRIVFRNPGNRPLENYPVCPKEVCIED